MKKIVISTLVTATLTIVLGAFLLELQAQREQLKGDEIIEIYSQILDEDRKLLIHLPRSYRSNKEKRYPVIYVLDGTSLDHLVANAAQVLSSAGVISETIIVGIPNTNRNRDLTPHYMYQDDDGEQGEGDHFLCFLADEVMPYIQENFRANGYRALAGNSRSGLFTLYAMTEKPDLFQSSFCFSPALWRDDQEIVQQLERFQDKVKNVSPWIYLSLGQDENQKMKMAFESAIKLLESNQGDRIQFFYDRTPGAIHANNAYYSIPTALVLWNSAFDD